MRITAETCPHYLTFTAEEIPDGATQFKCCPPIREAANRELLWEGLRDGTIDMRRLRPLAVHRRPQALRHRRLRHRVGRDLVAAARAVGGLDRGAAARVHARRRRPAGCRDGPADQTGLHAQGPDRRRRRRRLRVFAPDDAVRRRRRARCTTRTPSRRTPAGASRASSAAPGCAAQRIDIDAEPRGRLLTRGDRTMNDRVTARTSLASPDLASRALAGSVVYANDELFAERENLIKPGRAGLLDRGLRPQGQGVRRLGDPPSPRARPRLRDRAARRARGGARRRHRHLLVQGQLPAARLRRGCVVSRATRRPRSCESADWVTLVREVAAQGRHRQLLRGGRRAPVHPRAAVDLSPTAASPASGCTASRCRTRGC